MPDSPPQDEETRHIPPTADPAKEEEEQPASSGGLLSAIGDPAGKVLHTTLRPLGAPLEKTVTAPLGAALGGTTRGVVGPLLGHDEERMEVIGGGNKDSYESGKQSLGGREQTGGNPLGLDQSGRWGFEEEGGRGEGGGGKGREGGHLGL